MLCDSKTQNGQNDPRLEQISSGSSSCRAHYSKLPFEDIGCYYSQKLRVYIQGDLKERAGKIFIISVHDVGTNHNSIVPFVLDPHMNKVFQHTIWLHICLPGQDEQESQVPDGYEFPSLDGLAHDLVYVLEHFKLRTIIGFGEGAGANILCRFGLYYPNRTLGLLLIDCQHTTAGVDEHIKSTMLNWKEGTASTANKIAEKVVKYLSYHKIGLGAKENWKGRINAVNLAKYMDSYIKRTDISKMIRSSLNVEILLINGSRAPNVQDAYALNRLNWKCTTVVIVDGVADTLVEAPMNLARAFILFCKGCGVLLQVPMVGLEEAYEALEARKQKMPVSATQQSIAKAMLENERNQKPLVGVFETKSGADW